jgi:arsenate reductase
MGITVYGIKNCDTVKKARRWLEERDIDYRFHDFRSDGLEEKQLKKWIKALGWETVLNRRGTTWRKLPEKTRDGVTAEKAVALMLEQPVLIKRPIVENGKDILIGFDAEAWQNALK